MAVHAVVVSSRAFLNAMTYNSAGLRLRRVDIEGARHPYYVLTADKLSLPHQNIVAGLRGRTFYLDGPPATPEGYEVCTSILPSPRKYTATFSSDDWLAGLMMALHHTAPNLPGVDHAILERDFPSLMVAPIGYAALSDILTSAKHVEFDPYLAIAHDGEISWKPVHKCSLALNLFPNSQQQMYLRASMQDNTRGLERIRRLIDRSWCTGKIISSYPNKLCVLIAPVEEEMVVSPPLILTHLMPGEPTIRHNTLLNLFAFIAPHFSPSIYVHLYTYLLHLARCGVDSWRGVDYERVIGRVRRMDIMQAIILATVVNHVAPSYFQMALDKYADGLISVPPDIVIPVSNRDMPAAFWNQLTAWRRIETARRSMEAIRAISEARL